MAARTLVSVSEDMLYAVGRPSIMVAVPDGLQVGERAEVEYCNQRFIAEIKQAESFHPITEGDTGKYVEIVGRA